jgi:hypothetical protein
VTDTPAALPPVGETTPAERTDPRQPDGSGTGYTIAEAVERYAVSERTLRRELAAGRLAGASRQPSKTGERWQIPAASLGALYALRDAPTAPQEPPAATAEAETRLDDLRRQIDDLIAQRNRAQAALEAGDSRTAALQAERDELLARAIRAEAERDALGALAERLAAPEPRRRFWRRT